MPGSEKYWFNGLPLDGLEGENPGTEKYWFDGVPDEHLYDENVSSPLIMPALANKLIAEGII